MSLENSKINLEKKFKSALATLDISLVILIPLFAFLYKRGELKGQNYSILSIFP